MVGETVICIIVSPDNKNTFVQKLGIKIKKMNLTKNFPQSSLLAAIVLFVCLFHQKSIAQDAVPFIRIVELVVDAAHLEDFKTALKEDIETAVSKETGALSIQAVYDKNNPTHITVFEIFVSKEAHQAHQQTAHFLKFKHTVEGMVKSTERIEVLPIASADKKKNLQARPPATQPFGAMAFAKTDKTVIHWLGNAGFLINSRGTNLMVDPLLQGFDMPIMIDIPIAPQNVPHLDAVLITHADNDHYSIPTLKDLAAVTKAFHSTVYVDSLMKNQGFPSFGHDIGDEFKVGSMTVKLTPADHDWQNSFPGAADRFFHKKDCTGFWIETLDGNIWATGDSRLMSEHLTMPPPDAIFFDFSDSEFHFTFEGAVKLANAYPNTPLLLCHWGTIDAPDFSPFNGDPEQLINKVVNPERIVLLAPGEPYQLQPLKR